MRYIKYFNNHEDCLEYKSFLLSPEGSIKNYRNSLYGDDFYTEYDDYNYLMYKYDNIYNYSNTSNAKNQNKYINGDTSSLFNVADRGIAPNPPYVDDQGITQDTRPNEYYTIEYDIRINSINADSTQGYSNAFAREQSLINGTWNNAGCISNTNTGIYSPDGVRLTNGSGYRITNLTTTGSHGGIFYINPNDYLNEWLHVYKTFKVTTTKSVNGTGGAGSYFRKIGVMLRCDYCPMNWDTKNIRFYYGRKIV